MLNNISVKTEREVPKYEVGEEIVFLANVPVTCTNAEYTVTVNRFEVVSTGSLPSGCRDYRISVIAQKPCFIEISISGQEELSEAAAAVSPELIRPTSACPADFKQFWHEKLNLLAKLPLKVSYNKIPQLHDSEYQAWHDQYPVFGKHQPRYHEIDVFDFKTPHYRGLPVRGYLAKPTNSRPKSLPAVLFTHGAGITDSDLAKVNGAAKLGFLAMDINAHGLPNNQPPEYYQNLAEEIQEQLGNYFKAGRIDKHASYLPELLLRHRRALDVLCLQPEWDRKTLIIRGSSQGGFLAVSCAALDKRVTAIFAGVPGSCDSTLEFNLQTWLIEKDDNAEIIELVRETSKFSSLTNFVPEVKAEAWFDVAYLDKLCHPAAFYAMYNLYTAPKHLYEGFTAGHSEISREIVFEHYTTEMLKHAGIN
ncbi:acetylxylan esterase [Lentisphaerota bacterium ZTH]|nr:acetylxylan esterase [Lentisphaerota bacterium]WET05199.1 acetylxylan esterase [Lentisphaerota bacterium ZTH]